MTHISPYISLSTIQYDLLPAGRITFIMKYAKRRYVIRRKPNYRRQTWRSKYRYRRNSNYSSNSTAASGLRFKRKRFQPKRFIRNAYKSSDEQTKYRSFLTGTINTTVPTALGTCNVETIQAIPVDFMLSAGGLILGTGSVTTDDEWAPKLFVRGGVMRISFTNRLGNATNVRIKLWMAHARNVLQSQVNGQYTATGVSSQFDPTVAFNWYKTIRAPILSKEKILELGDSWTVEQRIRPFMHNQFEDLQTDPLVNLPWWIWTVEPCQVAAAASVDIVYGHNLSFSGDLNGGAY